MAKTADMPKKRVGNVPTPAGAVPPSALPFGREAEQWEEGVRPGAGGMGSKATGKGLRQGNTPHTSGDADSPEQRPGHGETSSENWRTRENGKLNNETTSNNGGLFPFKTAEDNASNYTQRSRIPRQEVKDAEIKALSDKNFKNEKDQRKVSETLEKDITNPRNQR